MNGAFYEIESMHRFKGLRLSHSLPDDLGTLAYPQNFCHLLEKHQEKRDELNALDVEWHIALRPGERKTLRRFTAKLSTVKAQVRVKVEHPFRKIKQQFGYRKAGYRELANKTERLHVLAAFTDLLICKRERQT